VKKEYLAKGQNIQRSQMSGAKQKTFRAKIPLQPYLIKHDQQQVGCFSNLYQRNR
jgi:hypothetical protein